MAHDLLLTLNDRWWDWQVSEWDGWSLRLIADHDLTDHHAVEVVFSGVAYVAFPMDFSNPAFRPATAAETEHVRRACAGDLEGLTVFAWETDDGATCIVAAEGVEVAEGHVDHHES